MRPYYQFGIFLEWIDKHMNGRTDKLKTEISEYITNDKISTFPISDQERQHYAKIYQQSYRMEL